MARRRRWQSPTPRKERGQWKIRYYTDVAQPDGIVQRVKKTKCLGRVEELTFTEAKKESARFLQPINDVEPGIEHQEKTLNELIQRWRRDVKPNLKRSTRDSYEWAFKRIVRRFGSIPVSEIDKGDVQAFLTASARELAPDSVYDLRARLRGLLTTAADWEWIPEGRNPAAGRLRLPERLERQRPIPTPQQFRTLLEGLRQPYRAIVAVAGLGGLRRGEIAALRWNDLVGSKLRVDEAVYRGELGTPKSKKSRRTVSIPSQVLALLEDWREQCKFTQPEDFMFSIRTNSPIDLNREMERTIKPVAERLGMPRFSWHDFRHAYTTWGRMAGVEAEVMRDQVGHASVAMTQDIYTHLGDHGAAADRIGAYVFAADEAEQAA